MQREQITIEYLAGLLREAEQAHAEYERTLGHRDEDWPAWYASFILERLHTEDTPREVSQTE